MAATFLIFLSCSNKKVPTTPPMLHWLLCKYRHMYAIYCPGWQRVFFSLEMTELSGQAAKASREAARKKPLAPMENNLTSIPTPISFDWHPQSELIFSNTANRFYPRGVKYAYACIMLTFHESLTHHCALFSTRNLQFSLWISLKKLILPQTNTCHSIPYVQNPNHRIDQQGSANCENLQRYRFASWVKVSQLQRKRIENHQSQSTSMTFWTALETNTEEHCLWFSRSHGRAV